MIYTKKIINQPTEPFYQLVLIRNGESEYSKNNLFCGWTDSDISYKGLCQAEDVGKLLAKKGVIFDMAFTSYLKRAIKTCHIILEQMGLHWIPVNKSWRLNARMYGMLQGCNKSQLTKQHDEHQVQVWRRQVRGLPPPLSRNSKLHPVAENKYTMLDKSILPDTECLLDASDRFKPYWIDEIVPAIKEGNRVLVVAHGSTLRVVMKYLDNMSDDDVAGLNIPPCIPIVYDFDQRMKPIRHYYMKSDQAVAEAIQNVIDETKQNPSACSLIQAKPNATRLPVL